MEYKEDCKSCIYLNTNGTCGNSRSIMYGVATNADMVIENLKMDLENE